MDGKVLGSSGVSNPRLALVVSRSQIVRFARFAIRRPSDYSRNLAIWPDQNAHLWSP